MYLYQISLCDVSVLVQNVIYYPFCTEPRPVVECSFVTEFEDHIFVAMDAEVILFLHDLILSYIKEKDKGKTLEGSMFCASYYKIKIQK